MGTVCSHEKKIYTLGMVDSVSLDLFLTQDGDHVAFTRVVKTCDSDIRRFCYWVNPAQNNIDDLVQETFFRAFKGISTFRGESTGRSWLLSIARRVCLDHSSSQKRNNALADLLRAEPQSHVLPYSSLELTESLSFLPLEFQEAFVLVRIFGFTYLEVSTILQCPQGTVQSRVARARQMLREQLESKPRTTPQGEWNSAVG